MRNNRTILVDQDDVLANYSKRLIEIVAQEYPGEPKVSEDELRFFETELHYSPENRKAIDRIAIREGFFENLEPIEGAVEALHDLLACGFDVRICTSPKKYFKYCVPEKFAWIEKHLGREFAMRIVLTRDKTLVRGSILIDDKPEITGVAVPEWEHVIYDRPCNRNASGKRRINWQNYREVLGLNT